MARIYFRSIPFNKNSVTLALESGVDGVIVPREKVELVSGLARCEVWADEDCVYTELGAKADEENAIAAIRNGEKVILVGDWEVIPVENMLAQCACVLAEAASLDRAKLASGILERGVTGIIVPEAGITELKQIIAGCKMARGNEHLVRARITKVKPAGLGHRVCIDTLSILKKGQGMLTGNSSAFTFLVHAETEHNEYVAARPFRVNAGSVQAYVRLPDDRTCYLGELAAGDEALVVDWQGDCSIVTVGRVKIEVRPMLLIEAEAEDADGNRHRGSIFLQNAETIRLTAPDGSPVSVVKLEPGNEVLCRLDEAGRHFGMRVKEEIQEV